MNATLTAPTFKRLKRFSELSEESKQRARDAYQSGWRETHPEEKEGCGDDIVSCDGEALFNSGGTYQCDISDTDRIAAIENQTRKLPVDWWSDRSSPPYNS